MTICPFCTPDNTMIILSNTHALALAIPDAFPLTPGHTLIIPWKSELILRLRPRALRPAPRTPRYFLLHAAFSGSLILRPGWNVSSVSIGSDPKIRDGSIQPLVLCLT
jgi:hypothetical protein